MGLAMLVALSRENTVDQKRHQKAGRWWSSSVPHGDRLLLTGKVEREGSLVQQILEGNQDRYQAWVTAQAHSH